MSTICTTNIIDVINIYFMPIAVLSLILCILLKERTRDMYHRNIFLVSLSLVIAAVLLDMLDQLLEGRAGSLYNAALYLVNTLFFLIQYASNVFVIMFVNYTLRKNKENQRSLIKFFSVIMLINCILLALNFKSGAYFYINEQNIYQRGNFLLPRMILSYAPLAVAVIDLFLYRKKVSKAKFRLFCGLFLPIFACSVLDLLVEGAKLMWCAYGISMMLAYIFIVRANFLLDSLTGVENRKSCDDHIKEICKTRNAYGVLMADIDDFKKINDTLGHICGDKALCDVANIMRDSLAHSDFLARYGGDEFLIILNDKEEIDSAILKITKNVNVFNDTADRPYRLSISIGYDIFEPDLWDSFEDFVKHIDKLMYKQKEERRGSAEEANIRKLRVL